MAFFPFIILILIIISSVGIAWALGLAGFIGGIPVIGFDGMLNSAANMLWQFGNSYTMITLPLFLVLGEIVMASRIGDYLFEGLDVILSGIRGYLLYGSVITEAFFGAMCGSSIASVTFLGKTIFPKMQQKNYPLGTGAASIAITGTLAQMIPPSGGFIIYGVLVGESIGKLFIAGIIPGIVLSLLLMIPSYFHARSVPVEQAKNAIFWRRIKAFGKLWPAFLVMASIIFSIYSGMTTIVESAAIAIVVALIIAVALGHFDVRGVYKSCMRAVRMTAVIMFLMCCASLLAFASMQLELVRIIMQAILTFHLHPLVIFAAICVVYLFLGCFMDGASMCAITLPIFGPLMSALGFDLIWFGVTVVLLSEIGLITPPVGLNVYVISSISKVSYGEIFPKTIPYLGMCMLLLILLVLFPDLATWLPSKM